MVGVLRTLCLVSGQGGCWERIRGCQDGCGGLALRPKRLARMDPGQRQINLNDMTVVGPDADHEFTKELSTNVVMLACQAGNLRARKSKL
jgi:hypothetical protein